jgi:hypothetical protein
LLELLNAQVNTMQDIQRLKTRGFSLSLFGGQFNERGGPSTARSYELDGKARAVRSSPPI